MPYSKLSELPDNVKKLTEAEQRQWMAVFNSAYKSCIDKGGNKDTCEPSAFAQAWGVINKQKNDSISNITETIRNFINRSIKKVETWDGAASNYTDTDAYCKACLIDVNSAAGKDTKSQDHCMLPVRESGDASGTYVNKAVHAAAGGHGLTQVKKPDDVPEEAWNAAVKAAANNIISAYGQMEEQAPDAVYKAAGKTPPVTRAKNLMEYIFMPIDQAVRAQDDMAWLNDVYADEKTGDLFAIITSKGKLYKASVTLGANAATIGEWVECKMDFPSITQETKIIRQKDGKIRWLSVACSSVINRNGQIDSRALFRSFVNNIERTGIYPVRQFCHCGKDFITGQADYVAVDDNLLLMSGIYNDTELAKREIAAREKDGKYWGESIGFLPTAPPSNFEIEQGVTVPVYTEGILIEESTVAEHEAGAWFTSTIIMEEVNRMLEKRQMEALVKIFDGDETAAKNWLEQNVDEVNRQITENGLVTLQVVIPPAELDPAVPVEETVVEAVPPSPPPADQTPADQVPADAAKTIAIDEETIKAIGDYIMEEVVAKIGEAIQPLTDAIAKLNPQVQAADEAITELKKLPERLAKLEIGEEERKRIWLEDAPPQPTIRITHRPRTEEPEPELHSVITMADIAAETLEKMGFK